jgi:hypothetical protein
VWTLARVYVCVCLTVLRRCYVCSKNSEWRESGSDTPVWLVGAGRVSSGPLGLQPIASYFLTCHSLESRGT